MKFRIKPYVKKHWDKILLGIFICLYIGTLATLSVLRHNAFASNFDLSNMDHTLWNTIYGDFFSLRIYDDYISRFAVHADLILILLSPLYLLWNDVRSLIIIESVFLGLGAIPVYLLSYKILKNKITALVIALVYLLNPAMQWTDLYDFHGVALAIPFLLFAFYFAYSKNWKWYGLFVLLALFTKENVSLTIAMMGLAVFFVFKNRKVGLATFVIGVAWFFLMVYFVMPHFSVSNTHWAWQGLGDGSANPLPSILKDNADPSTFIQTFFSQQARDYYVALLKPFGFLSLFGFPWLLIAAPEFAINILRGMTMVEFHYQSVITPFLVVSSIYGLHYVLLLVKKFPPATKYSQLILYSLSGLLLLVALRVNYTHSPLPTTPSCWCRIYEVTDEDKAFERVLQSIPGDASIAASVEIRPHINHRKDVWFVPDATESAKYIALLTETRAIRINDPKPFENELIRVLLSSKKHKVAFRSEHFYLFERLDIAVLTRPN